MRTSPGNPFQPFLLTMHERWSPEQIAAVITDIDRDQFGDGWAFSNALVMRLSQMPQVAPRQVAPGAPVMESIDNQLGKCSKCHMKDTVLLVEEPVGSGRAKGYCGTCAPPPAEEEDLVKEQAGA